MRGVGIAVLLAGVIGLMYSLSLDPSVSTGYGRINNIGLMSQKQNYVIASGVLAVVGAILFGFSLVAPKTEGVPVGKGEGSEIFRAIIKGNEGAVLEYTTQGGDLSVRSATNGMTPLEFARSLGRTKIAQIIERELQPGAAPSVAE